MTEPPSKRSRRSHDRPPRHRSRSPDPTQHRRHERDEAPRSRSRDRRRDRRRERDHSRDRERDYDNSRRGGERHRSRSRDRRRGGREHRSRSRSRSPRHDKRNQRERERTRSPRSSRMQRYSRSPNPPPPSGPRSQHSHNNPPPPSGPSHHPRAAADSKSQSQPRQPNGTTAALSNGSSKTPLPPSHILPPAQKMDIDADSDPETAAMRRAMGFVGFKSTKNTKVKGNNVYGVYKEKKTEYRQYMNRVGGFNRPLSPSR